MSYDKLQFPRVSFHHWLKKQVSEKEKKKITIVFKTSRGVLHFNEKKKKRIAVKLHHKSNHSEAANNTGSKGPDDEREGSGDPF